MNGEKTIKPIAYIRTDFYQKFGIPRQSGRVPELVGKIVFEPEYRSPEAIREIETFSHLWLIFDFSLAHREGWSPTVRPPRLGGNRRVGVFASRSPFRPNNLGLSCVRLICVEKSETDGNMLVVGGADLLDMTPIYDIKPYLSYSDAHLDAKNGYADNEIDHRLNVDFPEGLLEMIPKDKRSALISCLADDPRPSYQNDIGRTYSMCFGEYDIKFRVNDDRLTVIHIDNV